MKFRCTMLLALCASSLWAESAEMAAFKKQKVGSTVQLSDLLGMLKISLPSDVVGRAQPLLDLTSTALSLNIYDADQIANGYQIEGNSPDGSLKVGLRALEINNRITFTLAVQSTKADGLSLRPFLENSLIKTYLPTVLLNILGKIDEYIRVKEPTVIYSTIATPPSEPLLGLTKIPAGFSVALYIADGDCVLCSAKSESGLSKLGFVLSFAPKTTSVKDVKITPLISVSPQKGICLLKIFTAPITKILDDIGIQNPALTKVLNILSFCLFSSIGIATDDANNMVFYVTGVPKVGTVVLGSYGMIKGWSDAKGFHFGAGLMLTGDKIDADWLNANGFGAKFGADALKLLGSAIEWARPTITLAYPDPMLMFNMDTTCSKWIDPDPTKKEEQAKSLAACREAKKQKLLPASQQAMSVQSTPIDEDTMSLLADEPEQTEPAQPTQAPAASPAPAKKSPVDSALEAELKKLDTPFDFSEIQHAPAGIAIGLDMRAQGIFKTLLKPLGLDQGHISLSVPIKKCLTKNDIKVSLQPIETVPIFPKNIIPGFSTVIDALPKEVPLVSDLQNMNFTPISSLMDVSATGEITIIVKGVLADSPILGAVNVELYSQQNGTVIALQLPKDPNFAEVFGPTLAPFFEHITDVFALTDTLITIASFKPDPKNPTQKQQVPIALFGKPRVVTDGIALQTRAHLGPSAPSFMKIAFEQAGLSTVYIAANFQRGAQGEKRTVQAEIFPSGSGTVTRAATAALAPALTPAQAQINPGTTEPAPATPQQPKPDQTAPARSGCPVQDPSKLTLPPVQLPEPARVCPLKLVTSFLPDEIRSVLGGLADSLCMSARMFYTQEQDQTIFMIFGSTPDRASQFSYKLACLKKGTTQECNKTFGLKLKEFTIPGLGLPVGSTMVTYADLPSKPETIPTIFDYNELTGVYEPERAQRVKIGWSFTLGLPETIPGADVLKKITSGLRVYFVNKKPVFELALASNKPLCLTDIDSSIPDVLKLCVTPKAISLSNTQPTSVQIDATVSLFGLQVPVLVSFSSKGKYFIINLPEFKWSDLGPLSFLEKIMDIKDPMFAYADRQLTTQVRDSQNNLIQLTAGTKFMGIFKFKPPFDQILKLVGLGEIRGGMSLIPGPITLSAQEERNIGIGQLHSYSVLIDPTKQPPSVGLSLDVTLNLGSPIRTQASLELVGQAVKLSGSMSCDGDYCQAINKPFGLPIIITPIPAGSSDCPCIAQDTVCTACKQHGLPLTFSISISGGVPTGIGLSGLFQVADQRMIANMYADLNDLKKTGIMFQSKELCLEKLLTLSLQFIAQGVGIPPLPGILCMKNVDVKAAALPITLNETPLRPGAIARGEFDLLGLTGTLGLCVRLPGISDPGKSDNPNPDYDICKAKDPRVSFGVFAKGFVTPFALHAGDLNFVALTKSSKAPKEASGAGINLELSNVRQKVEVNGRIIILPTSSDVTDPNLSGLLSDEITLLLNPGSGTFEGATKMNLGSTEADVDVRLNVTSPLDSQIKVIAHNIGPAAALNIIKDLISSKVSLPNIPDIGILIKNLTLSIGKDESGNFGVRLHADVSVYGETITLDGTITQSGAILDGRMGKIRLLGTDKLLYVVDSRDESLGPDIHIELTDQPFISISGDAQLLRVFGGRGLTSAKTDILTKYADRDWLTSIAFDAASVAGFETNIKLTGKLSVKNPDNIEWRVYFHIQQGLIDNVISAINTVLGPIKDAAKIAYNSTIGVIENIDHECHKVPVISSVLCAPLDGARILSEQAGKILDQIMNLKAEAVAQIKSISFDVDLAKFLNVPNITHMTIPLLSVDFKVLGHDIPVTMENVTLLELPLKLAERIGEIIKDELLNKILNIGSQLGNILANVIKEAANAIAQLAVQAAKEVAHMVVEGAEQVAKGAQIAGEAVAGVAVQGAEQVAKGATIVGEGIATGATAAANAVAHAATSVVHSISHGFGLW